MTTALLITIAVLELLAAAAVAVGARQILRARRLSAPAILSEVLISTRKPDDQAIRGLTDLRARGPVLHLVDARVIDGDAELPAPELRVERDHVAYIQVL